MGLVRLPMPGVITAERTLALRARLLEAGTDAPIHPLADGAWLRISAQAYNEMADYDAMADLVEGLL
jgi:isopenicillin-N epimerase